MDMEKFTERSRGFLQAAQTIAMRESHQKLSPEHLLKALLDDPEGMAAGLISKAGGDAKGVAEVVDAALAKVPPQALDEASVAHLWDISEALTSVSYEPEAVDDVGLLSLAENSPGSVARSRHIPPIPMVQENDNVQ